MKRNRILANIAIALTLIIGLILAGGCKKQKKCGCDGDALDTLRLRHVNIIYDATLKTARFSEYNAIYYFCNPSEWMSQLSKFDQGEEILISGPYFFECSYLMNSSNSQYYNPMRIYQINVTSVSAYEYGK